MTPGQSPFWIAQWALVVDAPLPFIACVVTAIGVIWFLVNWGYRRQVDGLKQQIAAANQNMQLFKNEIPILEKQIHDVERSVERHDPYDTISETAANAVTTFATLRSLQSELLIPVRNRLPRSHGSREGWLSRYRVSREG